MTAMNSMTLALALATSTLAAPFSASRAAPLCASFASSAAPQSASTPAPQDARPAANAPVTELELAAAVLHLPPAELELVLARLPGGAGSERGRLLSAFAWAAAGERSKGAELGRELQTLASLDGSERRALAEALSAAGANTPEPVPGSAAAQSTASKGAAAADAASARVAPVARAMELALRAREAREALAAGKSKLAAEAFSDVISGDLAADWRPDRASLQLWTLNLGKAQAGHRWSPRGDWPSFEIEVRPGEGLQQVRKRAVDSRADLRVCTGLLERCNGVDRFVHPGQKLRVPTESVSIVVDREARWLLYQFGTEVAAAFEVAIGRPDHETTAGRYVVDKLEEKPMWFPEGREPVPFGDPRNPLGTRWIGWVPIEGGKAGLGIHGTNEPATVGSAASDGCVRMHDADIETLYKIVPRGTPVLVR
jgi:lipoprotein-anchoring transpeptidase ErfK/SrfK